MRKECLNLKKLKQEDKKSKDRNIPVYKYWKVEHSEMYEEDIYTFE